MKKLVNKQVACASLRQFGGSAAKAPYKEKYHKQVAHVHGNNQIAISMFDLNMYDFGKQLSLLGSGKDMKTEPLDLNAKFLSQKYKGYENFGDVVYFM